MVCPACALYLKATSRSTGYASISRGGYGTSQRRSLSSPLGLAVAPDGDVLTVNGGNGRIVEISPDSVQVATRFLGRSGSPGGSGALLGLAVASHRAGVHYLDDATTILRLLS